MRRVVTVAVTALVLLTAAPAHAALPVSTTTTAALVETSLNAKDTAHITGAVTITANLSG